MQLRASTFGGFGKPHPGLRAGFRDLSQETYEEVCRMSDPTKWFNVAARNLLALSALQVTLSLSMSRLNALLAEPRIFVNCIIYGTAYIFVP
jgi:hypothetical protein